MIAGAKTIDTVVEGRSASIKDEFRQRTRIKRGGYLATDMV